MGIIINNGNISYAIEREIDKRKICKCFLEQESNNKVDYSNFICFLNSKGIGYYNIDTECYVMNPLEDKTLKKKKTYLIKGPNFPTTDELENIKYSDYLSGWAFSTRD